LNSSGPCIQCNAFLKRSRAYGKCN
jgi:hypothetical protein